MKPPFTPISTCERETTPTQYVRRFEASAILFDAARLVEAADLAHELQRGGANLFRGHRRFEIEENPDIPTHARCSTEWQNGSALVLAATTTRASPLSQRTTVEMLDGNGCKVDVLKAPDIDRRRWVSLRIDRFGVRVDAARFAEMMLDMMFVERISAYAFTRRQQLQLVPWHEPQ